MRETKCSFNPDKIGEETLIEVQTTGLMVLKDREEKGYFIGYLIKNETEIWCADHHYDEFICMQTIYLTFSDAVTVLQTIIRSVSYERS